MKPITSLIANANAEKTVKPNDKLQILKALSKCSISLTYTEIAFICGWVYNPNKASRRLPELLREGKITKCDNRICTQVNSLCSTYKITD